MKKDARLLRIGVLGCGPIAQFAHFDACRKARNAELYAICDIAEDLLTRMAAIHKPNRTYRKYEEMLSDPEVEAVIVAVSDQFHVPLALKALGAGKHVLVEKPLGTAIEECEKLAAQVAQGKLVLQVGNNRRFDPGVEFAQRFIREQMGADLTSGSPIPFPKTWRQTAYEELGTEIARARVPFARAPAPRASSYRRCR